MIGALACSMSSGFSRHCGVWGIERRSEWVLDDGAFPHGSGGPDHDVVSGPGGIEGTVASPEVIEPLMRAAHSLKGAARIVGLDAAVRVAHVIEDCFVAAQKGKLVLQAEHIDSLLQGVDLLVQLSQLGEFQFEAWQSDHAIEIDSLVTELRAVIDGQPPAQQPEVPVCVPPVAEVVPPPAPAPSIELSPASARAHRSRSHPQARAPRGADDCGASSPRPGSGPRSGGAGNGREPDAIDGIGR